MLRYFQKTNQLFYLILGLFATQTASLSWAGDSCNEQLHRYRTQSAIETEKSVVTTWVTKTTGESRDKVDLGMLSLLTTENGKLSGLFSDDEMNDLSAFDSLSPNFPPSKNLNLSWDGLSPEQKVAMIDSVSRVRAKTQKFFLDRQIHGLVMRDEIKILFPKRTNLFGTWYEKGRQAVNPKNIFESFIEYRAPPDLEKKFTGIELHIRKNIPAGTLAAKTYQFYKLLGTPLKTNHLYLVGKTPDFKPNPVFAPLAFAEFYRRVNLIAELITIFKERNSISTVSKKEIVYFDHLRQTKLASLTRELISYGLDLSPLDLDSRYKMAWVGLRNGQTLDQRGLWALEFRSAEKDEEILTGFYNYLHQAMSSQDYFVSAKEMQSWWESVGPKNNLWSRIGFKILPEKLMGDQWYAPSDAAIRNDYFIPSLKSNEIVDARIERAQTNILFHDWTKDPIFYKDSDFLARLKTEQSKYRRLFENDPAQGARYTRAFLIDSGLADKVLSSLGFDLSTILKPFLKGE